MLYRPLPDYARKQPNRNTPVDQAGSVSGMVSCLGSLQSGTQYYLLNKNESINSSVAVYFLQSIDYRCYTI